MLHVDVFSLIDMSHWTNIMNIFLMNESRDFSETENEWQKSEEKKHKHRKINHASCNDEITPKSM